MEEREVKCKHGDGREATKGDECYAHYLKSIGFNMGHLRNRMYPGLTNRETEQRIREEAHRIGEEAVPADWV